MSYACPACGGPNENTAGTRLINCIWCGTAFRIPADPVPSTPAPSDAVSMEQQTAVPADRLHSRSEDTFVSETPDPAPAASQAVCSAQSTASAASAAAAASTSTVASIIHAAQDPNLANDPAKAAQIAAAAAQAAEAAIAAARASAAAATAAAADFEKQKSEAEAQAAVFERQKNEAAAQAAAFERQKSEAAAQAAAFERQRNAAAAQQAAAEAAAVRQAQGQAAAAGQAGGQAPAGQVQGQAGGRLAAGQVQGQPGGQAGSRSAQSSSPGMTHAGPRFSSRKFPDGQSGIVLATAVVPENYTVDGTMIQKWQSDIVPFTASIRAASPDRSIYLASTSGEFFSYYINPLIRAAAARVPNAIKTQLRDFVEPDEYLHQYARNMAGVPLVPVARAKLPSVYGKDLQAARNELIGFVRAHTINIGVQVAVSTYYVDAFLYRYEAVVNGRKTVFLAGCDYKGVESYDASNSIAMTLGGGAGLLAMGLQGGLLAAGRRKREKEMAAQKARAGAAGSSAGIAGASPTGIGAEGIPFGHGKQYGKRVDQIDWGSERFYFMAAPVEAERAATEVFLRFVGSVSPDPALWKQRNLLIEQMYQQRIMEAQQLNAQAMQMRVEAQRRQAELSRQIQQNNEEIRRGRMDSWEKQSASHSRMSENWSQAIRGVDTWQTSSGRTVEASVSADHVYQDRYGDTIEVSGPALDDELASRLDWTELKKK